MYVSVLIRYKDKLSYNRFLKCCKVILSNRKIGYIKNIINKRSRIVRFTPLKSPHVNKRAQKHFHSKICKKQINFSIINNKKIFIFLLKKISCRILPPINLIISFTDNKSSYLKKKNKNLRQRWGIELKHKYFDIYKYKNLKNFKKLTSLYLNEIAFLGGSSS